MRRCLPLPSCIRSTSRTFADSSSSDVSNVASEGRWDAIVSGYGWHIDGYPDHAELNAYSWGGGAAFRVVLPIL